MTDPFSITAGAVGICAAFTMCVDCFEYIQFGRNFGRDFQTEKLALDCARLRLTRWGEAVNIYEDPQLGRPNAKPDELKLGRDILQQMLVLFEGAEKKSKEYRLKGPNTGEDPPAPSKASMDPGVLALSNEMKALAVTRRKHKSFRKLAKWALHDRSDFKSLISDITSLMDNLEQIFPPPRPIMMALVSEEMDVIREQKSLELLEHASKGIDGVLQDAVEDFRSFGHRYSDIKIDGRAQMGDQFGTNWSGEGVGVFHQYKAIDVEKGAKVLLGNNYGGKSVFDD